MPDRYIEKTFIYLLCLSLLLHLGVFAGLYFMPAKKQEPSKEPVFVDLQQIPELKKQTEKSQPETKRLAEQRVRVAKETAPRGDFHKELQKAAKPTTQTPVQQVQQAVTPAQQSQPSVAQQQSAPGFSTASLLKPRAQNSQQTLPVQQLFPGASRLAKLEESYRRKFENDIAEGDTRFLNSDDIVFGSFLRRFEGAVYGVWRYPQEAAMKGIEGVTPVRITFNRRGEISNIQQLESSGARILDEEVLRTLRAIGPVGGFPKGYTKDEFHLIAFFQYGGARRSLR